MDILRKELTALYKRQGTEKEMLPEEEVRKCIEEAQTISRICHCYTVLTDISHDQSWLCKPQKDNEIPMPEHHQSSDEDVIYSRIHPADLVDKRMLEYQFFQYIERLSVNSFPSSCAYKAICRIRLRDENGKYVFVDNSTQVLRTSPKGKMWLILCCYGLAATQQTAANIGAHIVCASAQQITPCFFSGSKDKILSTREKEILECIRAGKQSKEIAEQLNISLFTVSRHRQNILQKLSVNNSMEAVNAAISMGLI